MNKKIKARPAKPLEQEKNLFMKKCLIQKNGASLKSLMSRRKLIILFLLASLVTFSSCKKETENNDNSLKEQSVSVSELNKVNITSDTDSNIEISDEIDLFVPSGTFSQKTELLYAFADNIPQFNDPQFEVMEKPLLLSFPISETSKSMILSMPLKPDFDRSKTVYLVSDGEDVFPLFYKIENGLIKVEIDIRTWIKYRPEVKHNTYVVTRSSEYDGTWAGKILVLMQANANKNIPDNMKGLKIPIKPIIGQKFTDALSQKYITRFDALNSIESDEKILLLIHGWGGSPESTWWDFLYAVENKTNDAAYLNEHYSKTVTFGYNSALHIKSNGELLANELKKLNKGRKNIDIVAHSMGGLVARVAIEKYGCDKYVRKVITLGTPHKGSPLGAYRNWLLAEKEKDLELKQSYSYSVVGTGANTLPAFEVTIKNQDIAYYKMNTEGFEDLDSNSDFIKNYINPSILYSDIQYTTVGAKSVTGFNEYLYQFITWEITPPHDGVVELASALGLKNNSAVYVREKVFEITWLNPTNPAHIQLTEDENVLEYVFNELKETFEKPDMRNGLVAYYPFNGNANDESGNGNHGEVNGATLTTDRKGNTNSVYNFGGYYNKGYIKVPVSSSLQFNQEITISVWIKLNDYGGMDGWGHYDATNATFAILSKDGGRNGICLDVNSNGGISFPYLWDKSNQAAGVSYTYNTGFLDWVHIVAVNNANTMELYLNGVKVQENSNTNGNIDAVNNLPMYIGVNNELQTSYGEAFWYPFNGKIDDVRIYNRALTDNEIQSLYNE
jgi:hypothetical protein